MKYKIKVKHPRVGRVELTVCADTRAKAIVLAFASVEIIRGKS